MGALSAIGAAGLVGEYRRAFVPDPRSVMSVEVLFAILELGGAGYLALLSFTIGVLFLVLGSLVLVLFIGTAVLNSSSGILTAIGQSLGSH